MPTLVKPPIITIVSPPESFTDIEDANRYIRDLHRDIEQQLSMFQSVVDTGLGGTTNTTISVSADVTLSYNSYHIFVDTDSGDVTVTLPVGVAGGQFRLVNTGTSGNNIVVTPNGAELLLGVNSTFNVADGEALVVAYDETEGWY
jgi:hypothetical protein